MAFLLNGWILSIGGASAVEGLLSMGPSPSSFPLTTPEPTALVTIQVRHVSEHSPVEEEDKENE